MRLFGYGDGCLQSILMKSAMLGDHLICNGKRIEEVVVSPLSLQLVLSLIATGSEILARRQIVNYFKADSVERLNSAASMLSHDLLADRMRCSTALWHHHSLTLIPSFHHVLCSQYRASLNPLDFLSQDPRRQINQWAQNETNGLVQDLIRQDSLTNSVKLVFTNALHFKGAWHQKPSEPQLSREDIDSDNLVEAHFMTAVLDILECGYRSSIHHYARSSEDKRCMCATFNSLNSHSDTDETIMEAKKIVKCNITSEVEASNLLSRVGITLPFSGGLTNILSCIEDGRELYVCNIFQKSSMQINDQGTEAATVTTAIVSSGLPDLPVIPTDFVQDYIAMPQNLTRAELLVKQVVQPHKFGKFDIWDGWVRI